jgi:two-component system chemotaxis sensor kinase CheA
VNQTGELRRQIEDMALQLVVGELENSAKASAWLPVLEKISAAAARENVESVVRAVAVLGETLQALSASGDPSAVSSVLQEGVAKLQQALESPIEEIHTQEMSLAEDPELMSDFIVESREHLVNIESQVLTLEREPSDNEALNAVFRGFHTIKGLAGFLELWEVQKLAHEVETVLDRARNSQWTINPAGIDVILASADYLRRWLAHMEAVLHHEASQAPARDEALLSRIARLSSEPGEPAPPGLAALAAAVSPRQAEPDEIPLAPSTPAAAVSFRQLEPDEIPFAPSTPDVTATPGKADEPVANPAAAAAPPAGRRQETMSVKVDTAKLDHLVDMAGEMVIAESLVRHDQELSAIKNPLLLRKIAHLTCITVELQKTAMAMRLVPIGPLFRKMARLVRDLSRQFGKQVEMETQGDEIELDRNIVEELADPLMHMVRNALDHGIETPGERQAAGKPPAARLLLRAHHRAGQVVIEITDDGRGLNRVKIIEKAVQKGLIASADGLSDNEIYNLIFQPGFSTAAQVTNVSGRGVGMDVVRRHIEKLRGRIEIRSTVGAGASFLLKLPLTLAIIEGLVVGVGQERYIVPLFAIREMFRPTAETIWTVQQRAEMALVRGSLLPVVRLYRIFHVQPKSEDPLAGVLVVAEVEGQRFCVLVDELIGKQEVVIKTLGETFKNVTGVAGGAILGDGRVGLILDLDRISKVKDQ